MLSFFIQWIRHQKNPWTLQTSTLHVRVWWAFYINATISAVRGFFAYGAIRVIRDSALVYYSLFTHLTVRFIQSKTQLKTFGIILALAAFLKMEFCFLDYSLQLGLALFQSAAVSITIGCLLIASLSLIPLWQQTNAWWAVVTAFALSELIHWQTRSSWTGFFVFLIFWFISVFTLRVRLKQIMYGVVLLLVGFGLHLSYYYYIFPQWIEPHISTMRKQTPPAPMILSQKSWKPEAAAPFLIRRSKPVRRIVPKPTPALTQRPIVSTSPITPTINEMTTPVVGRAYAPPPVVATTIAIELPKLTETTTQQTTIANLPVPVTNSSQMTTHVLLHQHSQARSEVRKATSLFQGDRSPNVSTRICMTVDAIEEIFGVHLTYSSENIRDPYLISPDVRDYLEHRIGPIILDHEIKKPMAFWLVNNRILRILNGLPFGKNFIPVRMFWRMWETERYDPHDSHIAMLYRTGVIGFSIYFFLVITTFLRGFRFARQTPSEEGQCIMITVLGCILFHFVHSATDVTLENSYKGIIFWVLLGLVDVVRRLYQDQAPSA
jgi:hypothetical protein